MFDLVVVGLLSVVTIIGLIRALWLEHREKRRTPYDVKLEPKRIEIPICWSIVSVSVVFFWLYLGILIHT